MRKLLPNFLMLFASLCFIGFSSIDVQAQGPMYHNNPTGGGNTIPFYYTGAGCRGQQLYPVGTFGTPPSGQVITTVYFKPGATYNGTQLYSNFEVYLKQANIASLSTTYETGMTQVFNATGHSITYVGGQWFAIQLQQPFHYDPNLPLIWEINQLTSGGSTWAMQTAPTITGSYRSYAIGYNASVASGAAAYNLSFGFDLAPASTAENDAGVSKIDSPIVFCPGPQNIVATVRNYGINQITSVIVNWKYNGFTQTPVMVNTTIDTFNGVGLNEVQVKLGTKVFASGVVDNITAWTSLPNNKVDTSIKNDTAMGLVQPSLAGSFTVNPSGVGPKNYTSISDAIRDLVDFGVCGPVTVSVAPGTYNEQMDFGKIPGTSNTNFVKFLADTNSGGVVVQYGATGAGDNFVVQLNGSSYITLDGFTFQNSSGGSTSYRKIFNMGGSASYNTMSNCHLIGYGTSSSSANFSVFYCSGAGNNYNRFLNNKIDANGQYYGLYFFGGSTTATNIGNEFISNDLNGAYYMGAYIYYHTGTKFNHNKINSTNYTTSGTSYGVYSYYGYEDVEFVGNQVHFGYYGMNLSYFEGSPTKGALIANNWVTAGQGTYYTYGMYMYGFQFAKVVNNTVWIRPLSTYGYYGMYFSQGTANMIVNNLVYAPTMSPTYYGIYLAATSIASEIDYNNVFTNANYGYYNGAQNTLTAWKNAGAGEHSYDIDPAFTTADSLRTCSDALDNLGKPLEFLTQDIDMDLRSKTTPDIGADEYIGSDSSSYSGSGDGELCNGAPILIGGPITGSTYQWSTGAFTPQIQVTTPGDYSVVITSSCGGTFVDPIKVTDITPSATFTVKDSYISGRFTNTSKGPDAQYRWVVKVNGVNDTIWSKDLQWVFPDNGPYEVCLTTYNKCDTVSSCKMWQGAVGIADTELDRNINMFPNPASNNVTIQFNDLKGDNLAIELINIQGQVVYTNNLVDIKGSGTETIDVSSLNGGMYIVRFITDNDIATKQLIVK